jgi:D-apiose dehydrogenase
MKKLRFAMIGTGFWSQFQLAGWLETGLVECVALCNLTREPAEKLAQKWGVPSVYTDAETMLNTEQVDFIDICTNVETHERFVRMGAERGLHVVCQKPMGVSLAQAEAMVAFCQSKGVKFCINENWRWQHPLRELKKKLQTGNIGKVFRARVHYVSSFPVFENQPFLKELEQFIVTDMGTHILDVARFLFGEASSLYAHTYRVHPDIKGEDVATCLMKMGDNVSVTVELSYSSKTEIEAFPQVYIYIEGDKGFLELGQHFKIRETTDAGTLVTTHLAPHYEWADPAYDLIHSSIVATQANIAQALLGEAECETSAEDNLKTLRLVFGAYTSAETNNVVAV